MAFRLEQTRVEVVGLGKSGLAAIELCLRLGAKVRAVDEKPVAQLGGLVADLAARGVTLAAGGIPADLGQGAQWVVVSPGVPLAHPALKAAAARGVRIIGEVELAFRALPEGAGPVLGITGTNGKSTTTALCGDLVRASGTTVFVGGNLGRPFSEACTSPHALHVVELSSFQLEGIDQARFAGAAILNLTPDHIDRYPSQREYGAAKARIFANQRPGDFAVVNLDDAQVVELAKAAPGRLTGFTLSERLPAGPAGRPWAGGAHAATSGFVLELEGRRESFRVENRALRGTHNLANAMAAALLARQAGISAEAIQDGLNRFGGLPHRLEWVRTLGGVEYINDSKATNVDSSLVAVRALERGFWLIAGGKGKGAPYAPLVEACRGKVRGVLTIGQDAPAIEQAFAGTCRVEPCLTLANAVARARELAQDGEVVLLSPACASYDQFKHFEDRGDTFRRLVEGLTP